MNNESEKTFILRLKAYRRQQKRRRLGTALAQALILLAPLWLALLAINGALLLPSWLRWAVLLTAALGSLTWLLHQAGRAFYLWAFQPGTPSLNQVALEVGSHYASVHDRLANALQLLAKLDHNQEAYSPDLIQAAFAEVAAQLKGFDFFACGRNTQDRRTYLRLGQSVGISLLLAVLLGQNLTRGAVRLFSPQRDFYQTAALPYSVLPGDVTVIKGQDFVVRVVPSAPWLSEPQLQVRRDDRLENVDLLKGVLDTLQYRFTAVHDSFVYRIHNGRMKSRWYRVSVAELVMIRSLQVMLIPPPYSRQEPVMLPENSGDVSALAGTRIEIQAETNGLVDTARVEFASARSLPMEISGRHLRASFALQRDDRYRLYLSDHRGWPSAPQIEYHLRVVPDQPPFVRLLAPGRDVDLGEDMQLPLAIEAQDDYGLSAMYLLYQVLAAGEAALDSARFVRERLPLSAVDHSHLAFTWDLSSSPLLPNESVLYAVQVFDNDQVSGPKAAITPYYRARFPSLYEMYEELASNQTDAIAQMESIYERSQELKRDVEEMQRELQRDPHIDWHRKQQLDDAGSKQEQIKGDLQHLSESLDQMLEKMEKNALASWETLKKYEDLQQLFREIMTPELQKAMHELAEAMQKLDPQLINTALEQYRLSAEDMNQNLDRAISLLKRFKIEQQLDQAVRTAQKLAEEQKQISETPEQPGAQQRQKELRDHVAELEKMLDAVNRQMANEPGMPQQEVQQAQDRLGSKEMGERLQEMQERLQRGASEGLTALSEPIQNELNGAAQELQQAKDKLSGAQQQRAMQALQRGMKDLLSLSQKQEDLLNRTESTQSSTHDIRAIAEEQQNVASALNRVMDQIFNASKESLQIDPQIGGALGQASQSMAQSLEALESRNHVAAAGRQGQAMSQLNRAAKQMYSAMQSMMPGGSGGMSMEQFIQQMQSLSKGQQGVNQQTLALGMDGAMGSGQQEAMARLAAEQAQLRKSLEQLAQESGNLAGSGGRLEKMIEDMKKVEQDLGRQITRNTVKRQEQILSRMLDAQKSLREREYSKDRRAETGRSYSTISPGELPADLGDRKQKWQQDFLRAKKEGYSRDYLELIKQYYEALFEKEQPNH
ncbi:DUF4175 domain-containing protein [bacterium]|nr:DUF4175 domain-containing protein [bacterium]